MLDTGNFLQAFVAVYLATGAVLAAVLTLGWRRRIRAHIAAVLAFLVGFGVTVYLAETGGRLFTFDVTARTVHLPLAWAGSLSALLPIVTGVRRFRGSGSLRAHRIAIVTFLVCFVAASGTGAYMLSTRTARVASGR